MQDKRWQWHLGWSQWFQWLWRSTQEVDQTQGQETRDILAACKYKPQNKHVLYNG